MAKSKRRASRPNASSWDKIAAQEAGETIANREVHDGQQLDRAERKSLRSTTPGRALAVIAGILTTTAAWLLFSIISLVVLSIGPMMSGGLGTDGGSGSRPYYVEQERLVEGGGMVTCYQPVEESGEPIISAECYEDVSDVPVPDWYEVPAEGDAPAEEEDAAQTGPTLGGELAAVSGFKLFLTLGSGLMVMLIIGSWSDRQVAKHNVRVDHSDINEHYNDQHIALPEEIQRKFDWFPDVGAHSGVQVSSMISHMMLSKKGLGTAQIAKRAESDVIDEDGNPVYYKGEIMDDADGEPIMITRPLIDEAFGDDLFEASGLPRDKSLRKKYDATVIPYNPPTEESRREARKAGDPSKLKGADRDKLGPYKTVADLIREDWTVPEYEVQLPGGAYMVDTAPVNTMVLAITRAGKGQTYIEPVIDMWSREKRPSNMVINDPKGELLVKNYIRLVTRGFEPVQFNLINSPKTDIYNPLGLAAEAAREGDSTKCAQYVDNIGEVFFSSEGQSDPVWSDSANNAFKRACFGLIDYYMEEERELRAFAAETKMDPAILEQRLDDMWGKVTLYNCYQMFVQLSSKKVQSPEAELEKRIKAGEFAEDPEAEQQAREECAARAVFWEGKPELDMLSLYFNATEVLPQNGMRGLVTNAHNSLRSMGGAEKMLASVYGIAITGMSFFTVPRIARLTSGKPSQNTDLAGMSFPRRLGVRFAADYIKRDHLKGLQAVWSAYGDAMFTENLGKKFAHSDIVSPEGWARYYFEGIFENDTAWIKLELKNPQSGMLVRTYYFQFSKSYLLSLNGRHYVVEPVTGKKIIRGGVLREMRPVREGGTRDGKITSFAFDDTRYPHTALRFPDRGEPELVDGTTRAITQTMVRYSESPKAVFLVTPPNLTKDAKLILILLKQLVNLNFEQSYMTKSNQKPLYRTRFMLDELGNLQSEGQGIADFQTMLSIGLGQEQQFTLILQTLQQLRDVYGDSVDKIVQGNVSNIIFLKSTDDSMIEQLEKMSGKRHVSRTNSKQITENLDKMLVGKTDAAVSRTTTTEEEPLISYNDMAFIPERNSIVFRAGDAPIWNRNETILPMSFRLFKHTIEHPGHEYSLQTIPTLSSASDFDVRTNQPDFRKMLDKRLSQGFHAARAKEVYQNTFELNDFQIAQLDPDVHSDAVMEIVTTLRAAEEGHDPNGVREIDPEDMELSSLYSDDMLTDNVEVAEELAARKTRDAEMSRKVYAEGTVSKEMLVTVDEKTGEMTAKVHRLDQELSEAYRRVQIELERDSVHFSVGGDGSLRSADGSKTYISQERSEHYASAAAKLNDAIGDEGSRTFSEEDVTEEDLQALSTVRIHSEFYVHLASLPSWEVLADGHFDRAVAAEMKRNESRTLD